MALECQIVIDRLLSFTYLKVSPLELYVGFPQCNSQIYMLYLHELHVYVFTAFLGFCIQILCLCAMCLCALCVYQLYYHVYMFYHECINVTTLVQRQFWCYPQFLTNPTLVRTSRQRLVQCQTFRAVHALEHLSHFFTLGFFFSIFACSFTPFRMWAYHVV